MNIPTTTGVASEVRAEMARQGITMANMAVATDISRASLSRKLNGTGDFTLAEMIRVSDFLNMTLSDLVRRAEQVAS